MNGKKIQSINVFYGYVPHKDVGKYINSFNICLLPNQKIVYTYEAKNVGTNISEYTSPLKLFEYMSHKKPIIASDLPVIREILNYKNSILVNCENIELWKNAIEKLRNSKNREIIANQAKEDFYKYTWKNRAKLIF